jgi:ABC-type antimicrobial peptide transport system permease subunit
MFGVIVGVASVIVIVGISQGVKNEIASQVNAYSKNVITVSSKAASVNSFGITSIPAVSTLTNQDVRIISKINGVKASVPMAILSGSVVGDFHYRKGLVIGTTQNLPEVLNQSLAYGAFFNNQNSNVYSAVLGSSAASGLFKNEVPLGYSLDWRNQQFVVNGVFNTFTATPFSNNTIYNHAIFIPLPVATQLAHDSNSIYQILVKVKNAKLLPLVDKKITKALIADHSGQKDFSVLLPSQVGQNNNGILNLMTELTVGIAIISLFVGGVGIMNVMLVSVTERMHEIGIRKAIGASNKQILSQFLIEAVTVSISGGLIGIVVAIVADIVIKFTTNLSPALSWQIFVVAVLISIVIGIVFGLFPAIRASRKEPIDALRAE